jgi:hypothetical protein
MCIPHQRTVNIDNEYPYVTEERDLLDLAGRAPFGIPIQLERRRREVSTLNIKDLQPSLLSN